MKLLSIDIETTGTDPNVHQCIQIGACTNDGQEFEVKLQHEVYHFDPFCIELHKDLMPKVLKEGVHVYTGI